MARYLQEQGIIEFLLGCPGREKNRTLGAGRRLNRPPPQGGWVGKIKIPHYGLWVREFNRRM